MFFIKIEHQDFTIRIECFDRLTCLYLGHFVAHDLSDLEGTFFDSLVFVRDHAKGIVQDDQRT